MTIRLYVQPKTSRSEVIGEYGEDSDVRLKVRIAAPPVDGVANEALIGFLKKTTGIPSSRIHLVRGETAKKKDVLFQGASAEEIFASLIRA